MSQARCIICRMPLLGGPGGICPLHGTTSRTPPSTPNSTGPPGPQGETGPGGGEQGIQGERGLTGAAGVDGIDGATPAFGVDYFNGAPGTPGSDGAPGANGQDGATGPPGTTDYTALSNKPSIPAAQVQTDWGAGTGMGVLLNKPTLGTAAAKNIPAAGNASATEVVYGSDGRLSDARALAAGGDKDKLDGIEAGATVGPVVATAAELDMGTPTLPRRVSLAASSSPLRPCRCGPSIRVYLN